YIVNHFLACFHRDPRDGYARGFQAFLEDKNNGTADWFLDNIRPDSDKSGAAMRAGPIGMVKNMGRVIEMATLQAEITHKTKGGVDS
ncbi:ADP-ribosylglycohydrolase family protein, partial [Acinetobacter baumannii]